jgi:hypothetical protein
LPALASVAALPHLAVMRRVLAACLVALGLAGPGLPARPAAADVFAEAAGTWGLPEDSALTCAANPHEISFNADRSRAAFRWRGPMINYQGQIDQEGLYSVLGHGADFIVLALDGETRRTHDGKPVIWVFRLRDHGLRYCWGRTDWPPGDCIDAYSRCPAPPAIG